MIFQHLFTRVSEPKTVRAALIGAGQFGTPIVTQAPLIPRLDLCAVADQNVEAARAARKSAPHCSRFSSVSMDAFDCARWRAIPVTFAVLPL